MMGLHGLLRLNLSHNSIQHITPDDFIGLDELRLLDISHNEISTLEETSKVCCLITISINKEELCSCLGRFNSGKP